ncbi:MAG: hypothetical protein ACI8Y7_000318 [Candidatus Woesearchaeota archaeon]|jgi:hypothetical protein
MSYKSNTLLYDAPVRVFVLNVIGQLRLYSLADLILVLAALQTTSRIGLGVILLHISFLLYLELIHKDSGRSMLPKYSFAPFLIIGFWLVPHIAILGYVVFSLFYILKKQWHFGAFSPLSRAVQHYFLFVPMIGLWNPLLVFVIPLIILRNFAGDLRDVVKDSHEGVQTLPVLLGIKKDYSYAHFVMLLVTTTVWWGLSDLSIWWLLGTYVVQLFTYDLTPR